MKNLLITFCLFLLFSCNIEPRENIRSNNLVFADYVIVEIDSCEYILFQERTSAKDVFALHKQNCKNHGRN